MSGLDETARRVLEARYLRKDPSGNTVETPDGMFRRVARNLAAVEKHHDGEVEAVADRFHGIMSRLEFLPNSPTLMNAGTDLQQLAACFVLPVEDSLKAIFRTLQHAALIHQSGGGTGFSFSKLRPRGDVVRETGGVASGPVSFMRIFDAATEQIKQGGRRRGANMGVLDATHPDVEEFIDAKREDGLRNFNLSVATDRAFWNALAEDRPFERIHPRTGETVDRVDPGGLLNDIAEAAWETGDPGILFLDRINEDNPIPERGSVAATNPCGEVPLLPYEACVLGSVNLGRMTSGDDVDHRRLEETVRLGIRLLDNCIEASRFPVPDIRRAVRGNRKIGLGVMGFHDMLVDLGVPYDSERAVEVAGEVMGFIRRCAVQASRDLAEKRGPFPNWEHSTFEEPIRNATTTSIAPTGTISLIAGCSSGIEPIYGVAYEKQVLGGLEVVNDRFVEMARERGFYDETLLDRLMNRTSLRNVESVPEHVRRLFPTAHDVPPSHHLAVQAAFQRHVDNAVSKTVNLPAEASRKDVGRVYRQARERNLKGVTVFRSQSRREQVLGSDPLKEECVSECDYAGDRDAAGRPG